MIVDRIIERTTPSSCLFGVEAARIIKSILEAVHYLHSNGSAVKLIDFGLSRMHDEKREAPVGTAYYMSPEVINGCYTKSCDIWSIGIVTYILLAGYPPFNGSNVRFIMQRDGVI